MICFPILLFVVIFMKDILFVFTMLCFSSPSSSTYSLMWTLANRVYVLWLQWINSHRLQKSCGENGMAWPLCKRERARGPQPLPGQAFIAFLGILHGRWSSFTMHRFAVGDYLLHITKERMLLITSKRRMIQIKGKSVWTGYIPYLEGLAQILGSYFRDMR